MTTGYQFVGQQDMAKIRERLERMAKSFNAIGYQGMQNAGRTGISALTIDSADPVMYAICAQEKQLKLMKNIKTLKATQPVYFYKVQTAIATQGLDLAGFENFMPQEDQAQYEQVAEPLKIYGIKKTLGDMVRLTNEAGGFFDGIDIEKENERNAAMALSTQFERDGYAGGDYYVDAAGQIDVETPLKFLGNRRIPAIRQLRGVQNNIREGERATRGVTPDFAAYGNSFSVVQDLKGKALDQEILDDTTTAVVSNAGEVSEAHATPAQIAEFRKTFFGLQRGDIAQNFAIRGPDLSNAEEGGFAIMSVSGLVKFIPAIYKHSVRQKALPVVGTNGQPPASPVIASAVLTGASVGSELKIGDKVKFLVQATSIFGISSPAMSAELTVTVDGQGVDLSIAAQADAEAFMVFMTPREAAGKAGSEGFVGKVVKAASGATAFKYVGAVMPGFESVLFMPSSEDRVKLAVLGNLLNKSDLGRQGLALESVFSSYLAVVLHKPRSFAVLDNVKQRRRI